MRTTPTSSHHVVFERGAAVVAFREWFDNCGQSLRIVGPRFSGKTFLAKQLSQFPECVAAHFCVCGDPQSSESATMIRALGDQLITRFPNLVLPRLSTVTLLTDPATALEHYLQMPLESMPRPTRPVFLIIDSVDYDRMKKLIDMIRIVLPRWIRTVVTSRINDTSADCDVHVLDISKFQSDFEKFIKTRLPNSDVKSIANITESSWFFVDQLAKAYETGVLQPDDPPPNTTHDLLATIRRNVPHLGDIVRLAESSRSPPTPQQLLAASQMMIQEDIEILDRHIRLIHRIVSTDDELFVVPTIWSQHVGGNLVRCFAVWAEHYKTKRRKTAQDVVELAYYLTHSGFNPNFSIKTLQSVGAAQLILKCPVIDTATTGILVSSGATIEDHNYDIVFACSTGDVNYLEEMLANSRPSNLELCLGLLTAAARGNLKICQHLVDNHRTVAITSCCGEWNALRSAACNGQLDVLNLLLSKGIHVDESGHSDRTALRAAAWAGQLAAVQLLLQSGAAVDRRDSEQRTALMAAAFMAHRSVVAVILQYGADVNAVDSSGATALHLALSNGSKEEEHLETVRLLIESGADCRIEDANGRCALHLAAYHAHPTLPLILEQSSGVDVQDAMGQTPLMLAASQGQLDAARFLTETGGADVDCIDENGRTALQWAAISGHASVVELLRAAGSDESHRDNDGAVALHYAVAHRSVELVRALLSEQTARATDRYGQHPLLVACGHGDLKVVREVMRHVEEVNRAALDGRTAVSVAALAGHVAILELLAPHVTDWTQPDADSTPLIHALILANNLHTAEVLLRLGASTSFTDAHGRTCAHVVASSNNVNAAKMLRNAGASFEASDDGGRTPLMTAIWSKHSQIATYLLDACAVDPNRCDHQGATALSIAAQIGDRELVGVLLRFGAEPTIRDGLGRTAVDVARLSGHAHVLHILKSATGSSDSSGIGSSVPNSPLDSKSRVRRSSSMVRGKIAEKR